jgi:hypothetical protein
MIAVGAVTREADCCVIIVLNRFSFSDFQNEVGKASPGGLPSGHDSAKRYEPKDAEVFDLLFLVDDSLMPP